MPLEIWDNDGGDELFSLDIGASLADDGRGVEAFDRDLPLQVGRRGPPGRGIDFTDPLEQRQGRGRGPPGDVGVRRHDHPGRGPPEDPPGRRRGLTLRRDDDKPGQGRRR